MSPKESREPSPRGGVQKSGSVLWTVPGGAAGSAIACVAFGDVAELVENLLDAPVIAIGMLIFGGLVSLVGSLTWRLPRYAMVGAIKAPPVARFLSGLAVMPGCLLVMHLGQKRVVDLPEPWMFITIATLMLGTVVGAVEIEAYFGRRYCEPQFDGN